MAKQSKVATSRFDDAVDAALAEKAKEVKRAKMAKSVRDVMTDNVDKCDTDAWGYIITSTHNDILDIEKDSVVGAAVLKLATALAALLDVSVEDGSRMEEDVFADFLCAYERQVNVWYFG